FIASGAVEVLMEGQTIRLGAGTMFGEMALLSGQRRNADVAAVDYCQLQVLERRDFNQFTARHPALRTALIDMAAQRRKMNQQDAATDEAVAASESAA
ncbi:cyclic nucleotide-binding domain-containing protein, partial [Azospirillum brasilense]